MMRRHLIALPLCLTALMGCAQTGFKWSANTLPPPSVVELAQRDTTATPASLRVVVQFVQEVAANDPAVLGSLQAPAQGVVRWISSVAPDTHVFSVALVPGQDAAGVLQRLAAVPGVKRVERDANVKAH